MGTPDLSHLIPGIIKGMEGDGELDQPNVDKLSGAITRLLEGSGIDPYDVNVYKALLLYGYFLLTSRSREDLPGAIRAHVVGMAQKVKQLDGL